MTPLQSVVLGAVQGLGEFLPISSSAHLILTPWLLGWPEHSLTYDVALHMGTLAALLIYFWRDWWVLVTAWLPAGFAGGLVVGAGGVGAATLPVAYGHQTHAAERVINRRLGLGIVIGTLPAAVAGVLFENVVEDALREPVRIAVVLIVASLVLLAADRTGARSIGIQAVTYGQALLMGLAQALALMPGVSRSGITLAAALFLGLTREAGARYAFLLAAPVTAGAGVFKLRHLLRDGIPAGEQLAFTLGILSSFVVGILAIGFFLRYMRRGSLDIFVAYRIALAALVLFVAFRGA